MNKRLLNILTIGMVGMGLSACQMGGGGGPASSLGPIAQAIARGEDHVAVKDLASWIVQGREDFMLVDIRDAEAYAAGHIDTATNLPLAPLVQPAGLADLPGDRMIVLYSNGSTDAAQGAALLRVAGLDAYSLLGGYNHWTRYTVDPETAGEADDDAAAKAKHQAVACYFSGDYVAAAGLAVKPAEGGAFTPEVSPLGGDEDPLGLGLGLGLGPDLGEEPAATGGGGGLLIGEGC